MRVRVTPLHNQQVDNININCFSQLQMK